MRRRASNQSTEAAAEAIATFMEVDSNGWQLLSTLNLLVGEGDALAEVSKHKIQVRTGNVFDSNKNRLILVYLNLRSEQHY